MEMILDFVGEILFEVKKWVDLFVIPYFF